MRNKKLLIIVMVVLLLAVTLSGCDEQSSDESKFIGTWLEEELGEHIIFYSGGTFESEEGDMGWVIGTYEIENNRVTMYTEGLVLIFTYSFSNDGNTLTLISKINDNIIIIKKQ